MLYLAEVQRKSRVIGSSKAEFKLLACQRSENSWSAVPGEEIIPAPDDVTYNAGAMVMVEVSANKQVQRYNEAGRQLVSILQNFSRFQEKFKTQEEEIEQWKQSLTYQSQELNRREMEMEARQEQLQEMEEDFEKLEQQRQEIEAAREELDQLRGEYDRKSQDLEGAWAHLRGELSKLEEQQAQFQQAAVLDESKANEIQELLNRLSGAIAPTEAVREHLNQSFDIVNQQQGSLDGYYQALEQQRGSAQQMQEGLDQQIQHVQSRWEEWQQAQAALEQSKSDLKAQQRTLELKQEYVNALTIQLQSQDDLYQQTCRLTEGSDRLTIGGKVDREALEKMPLDDLENVVRELEKDLEKVSRFVNSQEEELTLQQDAINELQQQIHSASDYDRLRMETELADEQDRYQMLNETLVGQRRNLQERQNVLKQHQAVLDRRKGINQPDAPVESVDLSPLLNHLEEQRQRLSHELQQAKEQLHEMQTAIEQVQAAVQQQAAEQENRWNEIRQLEQELQNQRATVGELWGKVNAYQETLQLSQDGIGGLRQKLEAIAGIMGQFQEASDYQLQAIAEMRQTILSLTENRTPEFAA